MSTAERITPTSDAPDEDDLLTVPDELVVGFLVTNPAKVRKLKARRETSPSAHRDEMWDGVYVMSPEAGFEHQLFVGGITSVFTTIVGEMGGGYTLPGVNVSDRVVRWKANYRVPDVAVYLPGNPAQILKAHACGGPDFAVEILSPGDLSRRKLDFYAKVGTRELLLLDRRPWALELYRLANGRLNLVGISTPEKGELLASQVLPLSFRLVPGGGRPTLELSRLDGTQTWRI
jgi:hypothetical protein